MRIKHLRSALSALSLALPLCAMAGPYSGLYVFGDSLSDNGSDYALSSALGAATGGRFPLVPAAPANLTGRFSNGRVAVEYLADRLGLALTPHYRTSPFLGGATGGTNYAQGGATSGVENASLPGTLNLGGTIVPTGFKGVSAEVSAYLGSVAAADPNALYIVWGGANDFIHPGATAPLSSCVGTLNPAICTAVTNIANSVLSLATIGARHILVPNLPDLGTTPSSIAAGPRVVAGARAISIAFNTGLGGALAGLSLRFPSAIVEFDTFGVFNQVLASASAFGFTDISNSCLTGSSADASSTLGPACLAAGADRYVFWDNIHPTTRTQQILGQRFAAALGIPEPPIALLLALGLLLVGFFTRRRHA